MFIISQTFKINPKSARNDLYLAEIIKPLITKQLSLPTLPIMLCFQPFLTRVRTHRRAFMRLRRAISRARFLASAEGSPFVPLREMEALFAFSACAVKSSTQWPSRAIAGTVVTLPFEELAHAYTFDLWRIRGFESRLLPKFFFGGCTRSKMSG